MKLIKEQQNKIGMELMTNEINENNYKQEISKSEDKLNKFLEESNLKFNNTLNEIYSNFIENTSNKDNELNMIKYEIKNSEEMVKQIKMNLKPIIEINQIQNNINALGKQMGDMNNIYNQIIKEHENIQTKNNELHQSLLNANNDIRDINNQISQNKINIDEIKNNYITKNNLKDINDKINNINNEIKALNETFENNKKLLNNANNEIKNINKTSDEIIQKEEYDKEMNKKNNEFNELKNFYSNKIDESNNNYAEIINQFNQFNEEEMNSMININKQFKDISDQVKLNNNDIKKLETENNSIYDEFILIKDKFKLLDKNISNLNKLENINVENKKEIEIINDRINNLENDLMLNKTNENNNNNEIDNLQLESLESLDNFNNKVNKENEIRENKYKELIKETQNNEMILENHINEINQKQEYNINEITNKLNEFKKQQFMLNEQNMKNIEQLNHGISEQIREYENIKQSLESDLNNNNNKKILETRINNLEREVDEWLEFSKKIDQLMVENMEENLEKIEEINSQMKNFRENVNNQFKEMKIYIDKTIDNFSNK
jgi:chromosome segregation ATPase